MNYKPVEDLCAEGWKWLKEQCLGCVGELLAEVREVYLAEPTTQLTEVSLIFRNVNSCL
jgi:hypothetical protein